MASPSLFNLIITKTSVDFITILYYYYICIYMYVLFIFFFHFLICGFFYHIKASTHAYQVQLKQNLLYPAFVWAAGRKNLFIEHIKFITDLSQFVVYTLPPSRTRHRWLPIKTYVSPLHNCFQRPSPTHPKILYNHSSQGNMESWN